MTAITKTHTCLLVSQTSKEQLATIYKPTVCPLNFSLNKSENLRGYNSSLQRNSRRIKTKQF